MKLCGYVIAGSLLVAGMSGTARGEVGPGAGNRPLAIGDEKQVFIDDLFFARSEGVTLRAHPPRKTGEKTLQGDRPWESVTLNWFSLMQDAGKYRMWYECYDADGWFGSDDTAFCYAESDDGIHWRKPELGLYSYKASKANNILFRMIGPENGRSRVHGTQVFKDPTAPAEFRYKGVSQGIWGQMKPPHRITGMYSADGLRWTRYDQPICPQFADSQYSGLWDDRLKKHVIYGRVGGHGRSLGRSESADFRRFDALKLVLQTGSADPPDTDLYNAAAMKYPYAANCYLMFPSLFDHKAQTLDIRIAVSRDGIHWTWPQRVPFIALGKAGEFDSGSLYMGQGMIRKGNELWQYYGGSGLRHDQDAFEHRGKPGAGRIYSRVVSRLDGFASAEAGKARGWFVTPLLTFAGDRLELNAQVRAGGELRVGLLDAGGKPILGRSPGDCIPITGDHVRATVRWKTGSDVSGQAGKPIRLRVEMTDTDLYAFQFGRGSDG
ncbi:MAG: hypothetical protein JXQ73_21250 [Phycisphaerae bacterium]|nr:hypothetical protein [Phycisphaerae bacterium]